MARRFTRREVLESFLGVPFVLELAGSGCDEKPAAPHVEGKILGPSMKQGHLHIRDGHVPSADEMARAPVHRTGVLVVGGGPAGLSAAWRLLRAGREDVRVLELEPEPGGTSVSGRSKVCAYPWGAHYLPVPSPRNEPLLGLLREMGVVIGTDAHGKPVVAEQLLVREPDERLFYRGYWYRGLYPYAGASPQDLAELHRFWRRLDWAAGLKDAKGRRAFDLPVEQCADDTEATALERISAREWLDIEGYRSKRLRWLSSYACADDYGLSLEQASAWALLFYWASRMDPGKPTAEIITWPQGNGALVEHLTGVVKRERIATHKLAFEIAPQEGAVRVDVLDTETQKPERWIADHVIVSTPHFITRRIVKPLVDRGVGDEGFTYAVWMVANLHLDGRPRGRGFEPAWDNVLYDSPSLGYVCDTHQRGRDFGPTVWTYYMPIVMADQREARRRLLAPSWEDWRDVIVRDLERAHPDLQKHLRRVDVWRWGHAMGQPHVGFVWGKARREAAKPIGRIHFAHSDLSGMALFEHAFYHGTRAAEEVLEAQPV